MVPEVRQAGLLSTAALGSRATRVGDTADVMCDMLASGDQVISIVLTGWHTHRHRGGLSSTANQPPFIITKCMTTVS